MEFWRNVVFFCCFALTAALGFSQNKLKGPLLVDGAGDDRFVWIYLSEKTEGTALEWEEVLPRLREVAKDDFIQNLESKVLSGKISAQSFSQLGSQLSFDEELLLVSLRLPKNARKVKQLKISDPSRHLTNKKILEPTWFSSYVNARAAQYFTTHNSTSQKNFALNLENVANFGGLVLENQFNYRDQKVEKWQRHRSRLTYDNQSTLTRWTLGDLYYPVVGFQNYHELGGFSVTRILSIDPSENLNRIQNMKFNVEEASTLEVYVNGGMVYRQAVQAGPIELSSIPLISGENDVQLKLVDQAGQVVKELGYDAFYYPRLLRPGTVEFTLSGGLLPDKLSAMREYLDQYLMSSFFRVGLSKHFLAGVNFQKDENTDLYRSWPLKLEHS